MVTGTWFPGPRPNQGEQSGPLSLCLATPITSMPAGDRSCGRQWTSGRDSNISNHAAGYAAGRSYGVIGANSFNNWFSGSFLAAARAGDTLSISKLNADGSTWDQFGLIKRIPTRLFWDRHEHFSPGYYRSPDGKRYLVSGSNEITGKTLWTFASVACRPSSMPAGRLARQSEIHC